MNDISLSEKLKIAADKVGGGNKLSKITGINRRTLDNYFQGRTDIKADAIAKIALATNLSADWFLFADKATPLIKDYQTSTSQTPNHHTLIPRFELSASAGGGNVIDHEHQSGEMAFRTDWLKSKNISPDHASVITVEGDSMKPTLEAGDSLLVNTSPIIQGHIQEGIYVISLDDLLMVKRLQREDSQTIHILSDNPSYTTITVTDPEAKKFRIIGRVIWHGRDI